MRSVYKRKKTRNLQALVDTIKEEEVPDYQLFIQQMARNILQERTDLGLTEEQVRLALVASDPRAPRIVTTLCELAGVSRMTYYNARQNPAWVKFQNDLVKQITDQHLPDAWGTLMQLVKAGETKALRLFFELRGDLVHRVEQTTLTETHEQRLARQRMKERLQQGSSPGGQQGPTDA